MRGARRWAIGTAAVVVALALVPFALGRLAEPSSPTATLQLRGTLQLVSIRASACPPGVRPGLLCPGRTATGLVPGLGRVAETYSYLVDETPSSCPSGSAKVLGYPVRWVIAGKGEITFEVHEHPDCIGESAFTADQTATVTGGTGIYAGASGSATADRALGQNDQGAAGTETWTGTLTVPGLEFDLTPPTLSGATSRTVRVPRRARNARVRFAVTAQDAVDGAVNVSCSPRSGGRFKVGRTRVTCSATDSSANTARASFTITVRRR